MNRLLKRQLKRYLGELETVPPGWEQFLEAVGDAYEQANTDRQLLERTIEINSQELLHLNSQMRAAIPDTFLRIDKEQGTILDYKPGQNQNAYLPVTDVIGKALQDLLPTTTSTVLFEAIGSLKENRSEVSIVHPLKTPECDERFYEVRLLPLLGNQVVAIIRDITERKQAEAALTQSQLALQDKTERLTATLKDLQQTQTQLVQLKG